VLLSFVSRGFFMFLFNSMATAGAVGGWHGCCNALAWDLRMRADRIDTWNRSFPLLFYRRNCMCGPTFFKTPFFDPPSIWALLRFSYYCYHIPVSENAYPEMWNGWNYECKDPSEVSSAFPADTAMWEACLNRIPWNTIIIKQIRIDSMSPPCDNLFNNKGSQGGEVGSVRICLIMMVFHGIPEDRKVDWVDEWIFKLQESVLLLPTCFQDVLDERG